MKSQAQNKIICFFFLPRRNNFVFLHTINDATIEARVPLLPLCHARGWCAADVLYRWRHRRRFDGCRGVGVLSHLLPVACCHRPAGPVVSALPAVAASWLAPPGCHPHGDRHDAVDGSDVCQYAGVQDLPFPPERLHSDTKVRQNRCLFHCPQ